jgi:hypothetical protein
MGLKYLVITSVDRDDLADGGAGHFRDVIEWCREVVPELEFELLVPDFRDCQEEAIEILKPALPFVFGHNVETVPALYPKARPGGDYQQSLDLLQKAKQTLPDTGRLAAIGWLWDSICDPARNLWKSKSILHRKSLIGGHSKPENWDLPGCRAHRLREVHITQRKNRPQSPVFSPQVFLLRREQIRPLRTLAVCEHLSCNT